MGSVFGGGTQRVSAVANPDVTLGLAVEKFWWGVVRRGWAISTLLPSQPVQAIVAGCTEGATGSRSEADAAPPL